MCEIVRINEKAKYNRTVPEKKIMAITQEEFKEALRLFASGVTVVTTRDADENLHGLTVSAFCSLSLEPPLILICIDKHTGSHHAFEESGGFVVNILRDNQEHLSDQFASPLIDKFAGVEYVTNGSNLPLLKDALVNLECRLKSAFDGGDHTIFIGEIERSHISPGKPLVYCDGDYRKLDY
jgi:flavin reductase (DIM6/NTAB) family NADH-FMN oxidoreductase RutF